MLRLLGTLLTLIVIVLFVFFTSRNPDLVTIDYYFGEYAMPVAIIVVGSLFTGAMLGIFMSFAFIVKTRRNMKKLKRKIHTTEQEVSNLRNLPIRDSH